MASANANSLLYIWELWIEFYENSIEKLVECQFKWNEIEMLFVIHYCINCIENIYTLNQENGQWILAKYEKKRKNMFTFSLSREMIVEKYNHRKSNVDWNFTISKKVSILNVSAFKFNHNKTATTKNSKHFNSQSEKATFRCICSVLIGNIDFSIYSIQLTSFTHKLSNRI